MGVYMGVLPYFGQLPHLVSWEAQQLQQMTKAADAVDTEKGIRDVAFMKKMLDIQYVGVPSTIYTLLLYSSFHFPLSLHNPYSVYLKGRAGAFCCIWSAGAGGGPEGRSPDGIGDAVQHLGIVRMV